MRFMSVSTVGRSSELVRFDGALAELLAGQGATMLVTADPGLGKSRLVHEMAERARRSGVDVAFGRASPGGAVPYRPFADVLLALDRAGRLDPARTAALRRTLSPVLPSWNDGRPLVETSPPVVGDALLRSFLSAGGRGTVVVLEDLHWADDETLAVIEYLYDNIDDVPLVLVATIRRELPERIAWFAGVARRARYDLLLDGLSPDDVRELVRNCLGGQSLADVERFVVDNCDGSPLLAEELLVGLATAGTLCRADGAWSVAPRLVPAVPLTLADGVRQRLRTLDDETREVLFHASIAGREIDWRLIGASTGLGAGVTLAGLRRAVDAQLVEVRDGRYRFRHALTFEAVRAQLATPEVERAAAALLEHLPADADPARVAALADLAGDAERAAEAHREAASFALGRGALASAVASLRMARDVAGDDTRPAVEAELAAALTMAGHAAEAREIVTEALGRRRGNDHHRNALLLAGARSCIESGDWTAAMEHLDDVVLDGDGSVAAECAALRAHALFGQGDHERAFQEAEHAARLAAAAGRESLACEALEIVGRYERFRDPAASTRALEAAVRTATAAGSAAWRLRSMHELAVNEAFLQWDLSGVVRVREEAAQQGAVLTGAVTDLHEAGLLLIAGEADAAEGPTLRCVEACRRFRLSMLPMVLLHQAALAALRHDSEAAERAAEEALALAPDDLDILSNVEAWVHGVLALLDGDLDEWGAGLDRAMAIVGTTEHTIPSPWRAQWALLAAVRGDMQPERQVAGSHAGVVPMNDALLGLARAVAAGRAGDVEGARRAASTASRFLSRDHCAFLRHVAYLLTAPDEMSAGWGDPEPKLRAALVWCEGAGHHGLAGEVRRTMRALELPVPRRGRGESAVPDALRALGVTSREMDVLGLVRDGHGNRAIGQQLHLSVRTVEKYVSSLLAKSGTADRRQLAQWHRDVHQPG